MSNRRGRMIVRKTFSSTHFLNFAGRTALDKREKLRREAEEFIANRINEEDVVSITESGDEYVSSVTVWYRK
jgi:hypothetical protein